jgi:hypothetical protein
MRLCFNGFCLGTRRPLAVEKISQSSQTLLTISTAIDSFNVTTFFAKNEDEFTSPNTNSFTHNSKMISEEDHNLNTISSSTNECDTIAQNAHQLQSISSEPEDAQNNNHLCSSQMELVNNDMLNNAVENIYINECFDVNMCDLESEQHQLTPKERDLIKVIQLKDIRIKELETLLYQRNDEIVNLKSHLDKFQSVFSFSRASASAMSRKIGRSAVQRQRAQGISAEPQSQSFSSMHELLNVVFPKYEKDDR